MSVVTITSFNPYERNYSGTTNVFSGSFVDAERVYQQEVLDAENDNFVIQEENESLYSKNCLLKDGKDYCLISLLKREYR